MNSKPKSIGLTDSLSISMKYLKDAYEQLNIQIQRMLNHISDAICAEYGLSVLDEDIGYKNTYNHKILDNDYYKTLKEDLDDVISYSVTLKQVIQRMRDLLYKVYSKNNVITIYKTDEDKVRIEKAFGDDYSIDNIKGSL